MNGSIYVFFIVVDMFNNSSPISIHLVKTDDLNMLVFKNVESQVPFPQIYSIVEENEFMYLFFTRQVC